MDNEKNKNLDDNGYKEKSHSKMKHSVEEETVKLLAHALKGSPLERWLLSILGALALFGGFWAVATQWGAEIRSKEEARIVQQENLFISADREKIKQMSQAHKAFYAQGTRLRNLLDEKVQICKQFKKLTQSQQLKLIEKRYTARNEYVLALFDVIDAFPESQRFLTTARKIQEIYINNINQPCEKSKTSDALGMFKLQTKGSDILLKKINSMKNELNKMINLQKQDTKKDRQSKK